MIQWLERVPLSQVCETCEEADCDVCEHGLERWYLSPEDELALKAKMLDKSIARAQRRRNDLRKKVRNYGTERRTDSGCKSGNGV